MQLNIKNEPICTRHRAEAEASSLSNSTLRTADSRKIKDANCLDLYSQERTVRKLCRRLFFFFFCTRFSYSKERHRCKPTVGSLWRLETITEWARVLEYFSRIEAKFRLAFVKEKNNSSGNNILPSSIFRNVCKLNFERHSPDVQSGPSR